MRMRWGTAWICVFALVGGMGCPDAFGRDGTIDRAVRKDVRENLRKNCSEDEIEEFCEDPTSEECLKNCGGPPKTNPPAQGGR